MKASTHTSGDEKGSARPRIADYPPAVSPPQVPDEGSGRASHSGATRAVVLTGADLSIDDIEAVARYGVTVRLDDVLTADEARELASLLLSQAAEIERLRAAGKGAQAEAEYAEYKRQHRAYAVSPDR